MTLSRYVWPAGAVRPFLKRLGWTQVKLANTLMVDPHLIQRWARLKNPVRPNKAFRAALSRIAAAQERSKGETTWPRV